MRFFVALFPLADVLSIASAAAIDGKDVVSTSVLVPEDGVTQKGAKLVCHLYQSSLTFRDVLMNVDFDDRAPRTCSTHATKRTSPEFAGSSRPT